MAKSRVSLKDRKSRDARGVDSIIKSTTEKGTKHRAGGTSQASFETGDTVKTTVYLRADQITAIEEIQLIERRRTGRKPDKYALAQEAFDLLIAKYTAKS